MKRRYYHKNRSRKVRSDSRTIQLPGHSDYGDGIDKNKYYRCWNCGFICNIEQNVLGGDGNGATYAIRDDIYSENAPPFYSGIDGENNGTPLVPRLTLRSAHTLMKSAADGTEQTVRRNWYNDGGTGCPFCHTLNWDGKQR